MKIPILTYHSVGGTDSVLSTPVETFRRQMEKLAEWECRTLQAWQLEEFLRHPPGGHRLVAITFDDAYVSVKEKALPILDRLGFVATIFVPTGACGRSGHWEGAAESVMSWKDLRELAEKGFELGSHGVSHRDLTRLDESQVDAELRQSCTEIEEQTSRPCRAVAYPYGRVNRVVRAVANKYYRIGVTTRLGWAGTNEDRLSLPRVEMYYFRDLRLWEHFADPVGAAYLWLRRGARLLRVR